MTEMEILPLLDFSKHVLVVGDTVLEKYVHGSYATETGNSVPTFTRESVEHRLTGSGNIVSNLQKMAVSVNLVTVIGSEDKQVLDLLKETGIDTKGLVMSPNFSIKTVTRYFSKQSLCFQAIDNEMCELTSDIRETLLQRVNQINLKSFDLVIITCCEQELVSSLVTENILSRARTYGIPTLVDLKEGNIQSFHEATYINLREVEFHQVKENSCQLESICKTMCEKSNFNVVFLSVCENGFGFYEKDRSPPFHFFPICKDIKVVDNFGTKDAAVAAVVFGLVNNWSSFDICKFAKNCANNVMTRFGTVPINMIDVLSQKVLTKPKELEILKRLLPKDATTVLTTGCFDLIHAGHIESLHQAKDVGDLVFVALNSDISVKSYKGDERPIIPIDQRCSMLQACKYVDFIVIFDEPKPTWIINILKPDVFVKGSEYQEEKLRQSHPVLKKVHLTPQLTSTSQIIKKIKNS